MNKKLIIIFSFALVLLLCGCSSENVESKHHITLHLMNDNVIFKQDVFSKEYDISEDYLTDDLLLEFLQEIYGHIEHDIYSWRIHNDEIDYEGDLPSVSLKLRKDYIKYKEVIIYDSLDLSNQIENKNIHNYTDLYLYYHIDFTVNYRSTTANALIYINKNTKMNTYLNLKNVPQHSMFILDWSRIPYYVELDSDITREEVIDFYKKYIQVENVNELIDLKRSTSSSYMRWPYEDDEYQIYWASLMTKSYGDLYINPTGLLVDFAFLNANKCHEFHIRVSEHNFSAYNEDVVFQMITTTKEPLLR